MKSPLESPQQQLPVWLMKTGDLFQLVQVRCVCSEYQSQCSPTRPLTVAPPSFPTAICNIVIRASSVFISILILPVVDCGAPPSVSNGSRTIAGTTFGETASYSCNSTSGLILSGSANITCLASGSWEPEPACTLTREFLSECVRLVHLFCSIQSLIVGPLPLPPMHLLEHPPTHCSMEW